MESNQLKKLYIVGKGLSILRLTPAHFEGGEIITINEAITVIRKLKLPNTIYTMQKDCAIVQPIEPERLLLHEHESKNCFPDYGKRYIFDNPSMGLRVDHPSALSATMLAHLMGFECVYYYGFDSVVGDCRNITGEDINQYMFISALLQLTLGLRPFKEQKIFKPDEI